MVSLPTQNVKPKMQSALSNEASDGITLLPPEVDQEICDHEVRHERPSSIRNAGCACG